MKDLDKAAIEKTKDAEYIDAIKKKYEDRQNSPRQLRRRQYALDNFSYVFNILSVLTASYFVYSITSNYPIGWQITFASSLVVLLGMAELAKRYCINEGAEGNRVWFIPLVGLIGISFYASYNGGLKFTVEQAKDPIVVHNESIDSLNTRIAAIDSDIAHWERQTWKGKMVKEARQGKKDLEATKSALIMQRSKLENRDLDKNDLTEGEHKAELMQYGNVFGSVAGLLDAALLICLLIARNDEKTARRLLIMKEEIDKSERSESVQNKRSGSTVQNRSRERPNAPTPNAPDLMPELVSDPIKKGISRSDVNMELVQYAQKVAPRLAEINKVKKGSEELENKVVQLAKLVERQNEQLNALKMNGQTERSNRTKTERKSKGNRTPLRNRKPNAKFVAEAKKLHDNGNGMSLGQLAKKYGKAKSTIHNWVNS